MGFFVHRTLPEAARFGVGRQVQILDRSVADHGALDACSVVVRD
jgi:hypothetical protein